MAIVGSMLFMIIYGSASRHYEKYILKNKSFVRNETRIQSIDRLIHGSDVTV